MPRASCLRGHQHSQAGHLWGLPEIECQSVERIRGDFTSGCRATQTLYSMSGRLLRNTRRSWARTICCLPGQRRRHAHSLARSIRFMQKYGRLAGIDEDRLHPHCCKHSLGTLMRKNGADIKTIQLALGHKNINSTAVYMNASEDEVDNARAKAFCVWRCCWSWSVVHITSLTGVYQHPTGPNHEATVQGHGNLWLSPVSHFSSRALLPVNATSSVFSYA